MKKNKLEKIFLPFSLLLAMVSIVPGCQQREEASVVSPSQKSENAPSEQNRQEVLKKQPHDFISLDSSIPQRVKLSHNTPSEIVKEITDRTTLQLIATSAGVPETIVDNIFISYDSKYQLLKLNWAGENEDTFNVLSSKIKDYIDSRKKGHTKEYLFTSLATKNELENASDADLKELLTLHSELPSSWLKKINWMEENWKDEAGNKCRKVVFVLIDGDIAWCYTLIYEADGSFFNPMEEKCDAKEYDPKYREVMQEVDRKVEEELERKKINGLGSCYAYWHLKKEYLKAKGIEWKTPSELNPDFLYD